MPPKIDERKLTVAYYIEAKHTRIVSVPVRRLKAAAFGLGVCALWVVTALVALGLSVTPARWTEVYRLVAGGEPRPPILPVAACAPAPGLAEPTPRLASAAASAPAAAAAAGLVGAPRPPVTPPPATVTAKAATLPLPAAATRPLTPLAAGSQPATASAANSAPAPTPAGMPKAAAVGKPVAAAAGQPVAEGAAPAAPQLTATAPAERDVQIKELSYVAGKEALTASVALASRRGAHVYGRVWGVARFRGPDGRVTLVSSNAGVNTADPASITNARAAVAFGAARLTRKRLTFLLPAEAGAKFDGLDVFAVEESPVTSQLTSTVTHRDLPAGAAAATSLKK